MKALMLGAVCIAAAICLMQIRGQDDPLVGAGNRMEEFLPAKSDRLPVASRQTAATVPTEMFAQLWAEVTALPQSPPPPPVPELTPEPMATLSPAEPPRAQHAESLPHHRLHDLCAAHGMRREYYTKGHGWRYWRCVH